jgi:uncharacterized protein YukE
MSGAFASEVAFEMADRAVTAEDQRARLAAALAAIVDLWDGDMGNDDVREAIDRAMGAAQAALRDAGWPGRKA